MLQARNAHVSLAYRPGKRPRLYTVNRSPPKHSRAHSVRVQAWGAGHTLAEAIHGDTWALDARAAMLNLKVDELNSYIYSSVDHAWLATCAPERKFEVRVLVLEQHSRCGLRSAMLHGTVCIEQACYMRC